MFSAAVCAGPGGLASASFNMYAAAEGENGTISCYFSQSGSTAFFCKNECKGEDILIQTDSNADQNGRFHLGRRRESSGWSVVSLTFSHLSWLDSGRFRCSLGSGSVVDTYIDFKIIVFDGEYLKADIFTDNVQMNFVG